MLTFGSDDATLTAAAVSLAATVRRSLARLKVELADGQFVIGTPLGVALTAAGFSTTPQGLRLRG
jgi:ATP-dependent Lhr-like helicase